MPLQTAQVDPTPTEENGGVIVDGIPIFNTQKLYNRWARCFTFFSTIVDIGFKHADSLDFNATMHLIFGLLSGSKEMQQSAAETHKQAHETRKSTLIFAGLCLLVAITATTLYWAVEEGVVGLITKSISACARSCYNALSAAGSWIKSKITNIFKRSNPDDQNITLAEIVDPVELPSANTGSKSKPLMFSDYKQKATVVPSPKLSAEVCAPPSPSPKVSL